MAVEPAPRSEWYVFHNYHSTFVKGLEVLTEIELFGWYDDDEAQAESLDPIYDHEVTRWSL